MIYIRRRALVRFDFRAGIGELHDVGHDLGYPIGAALHPDGTLAIAVNSGLYVIRGKTIEKLSVGSSLLVGVAWRRDTLEVVSSRSIDAYPHGRLPAQSRPAPWPDHDFTKANISPAGAYLASDGWHRLFTTIDEKVSPTGPIPVEVVEIAESRPARTIATLQLSEPHIHRMNDAPTKVVWQPVIDMAPGGVMQRGHLPYVRNPDDTFADPETSPASIRTQDYDYDYELAPGKLVALPRNQIGNDVERVRGRWIRHTYDHDAWLEDVETGARGSPITSRFWLDPGFKVLPATDGGMWIMGSLGKVFLHVDQSLERTDHLTFGERMSRLYKHDKAKQNSDFDLTIGRKLAVPFALLWFPAIVLPAAAIAFVLRRRERFASKARMTLIVVTVVYVLGRLVFLDAYSQLIGTF